ncbi:MAG: DUF5131 family protein [Candidatus Nitrosopolaris sp.]
MISNGSWVITGGESGFNHRECRIDWVREIRDECLGHTHLPIGGGHEGFPHLFSLLVRSNSSKREQRQR